MTKNVGVAFKQMQNDNADRERHSKRIEREIGAVESELAFLWQLRAWRAQVMQSDRVDVGGPPFGGLRVRHCSWIWNVLQKQE